MNKGNTTFFAKTCVHTNWFWLICNNICGYINYFMFITQTWALAIGFVIAGLLGVAATLCWKNQTIRIIDEDTFEYSTFLGKKIRYRFSEIKKLRVNQDSMTLFVGNGKVHIEAMVVISQELMDKIDTALANRPRFDANE